MKRLNTISSLVFIVGIILAMAGCAGNRLPAGPVSDPTAYPGIIEKGNKHKKEFIMSSGVNVYTVLSVLLDKNKRDMTVQLSKVDTTQLATYRPADSNAAKSSAKPSMILLQMKDSTSYTLDEPHTIPLANILKIEVER